MITYPTNKLQKVLLGGGCEQRNLPVGYTELQSVSGITGGACFDTGVAGNNSNLRFKFRASKSGFAAYTSILGNYYDENSNTTRIIAGQNANSGVIAEINRKAANSTVTNTVNIVTEHEYELYKESGISVLKVDGVIVEQLADSSGTTNSRNITINAAAVRTTAYLTTVTTTFKGHFYILDGVTLIREYVPAKRNSDNKVGFYDLVNNTFNPSMFDDYQFTAGADVVPSPSTPMDIVCNNGVIKVSKNLFAYEYFYDNYQMYDTSLVGRCPIKLKPNTTYTVSTNRNSSVDKSVIFVVSGNAINWAPNTANNGVLSNSPRTVTTDNNGYLCLGIYVKSDNAVHESDFINGTVLVQIEQGSTATSYTLYTPNGIYTEGTVQQVTDSLGNTATAERLLAVGNYKDTQEVLSGSVTRRIGIKVLDGTETITRTSSASSPLGYLFRVDDSDISHIAGAGNVKIPTYCTHFNNVANSVSLIGDGKLVVSVYTNRFTFGFSGATTAQGFADYLAQQYAQGTPVIIIYPLATPTTEQVTPQPLAGNTATVTAGSIDNLPIKSSTIAELKKRYIGDKEVKRVYIGENVVYNRND